MKVILVKHYICGVCGQDHDYRDDAQECCLDPEYQHLTLKELKQDLKRCKEENKKGNLMMDEIIKLETEIENRTV